MSVSFFLLICLCKKHKSGILLELFARTFHQTAKTTRRRDICSRHVAVDVACAALCMCMSNHKCAREAAAERFESFQQKNPTTL